MIGMGVSSVRIGRPRVKRHEGGPLWCVTAPYADDNGSGWWTPILFETWAEAYDFADKWARR